MSINIKIASEFKYWTKGWDLADEQIVLKETVGEGVPWNNNKNIIISKNLGKDYNVPG